MDEFPTRLAAGPFGDGKQILDRAAVNLIRAGLPRSLACSYDIHPLGDKAAHKALSGAGDPALSVAHLEPIAGAAGSVERWIDRSHPLDVYLPEHLDFPGEGCLDPATPAAEFVDRLHSADSVLGSAVPEIWESARGFVTRVYATQSPTFFGGSLGNLQGVVLLGDVACDDLWLLTESLLHESLHSKYYRLERSFDRVDVPPTNEFIEIPWHRYSDGGWCWDSDRAIVAAHVYTHIAHLHLDLSQRWNHVDLAVRANRCAFRAQYLVNVLLQLDEQLLDPERRAFLEWTAAAVPPIEGLSASGRRALDVQLSDFPIAPRFEGAPA